MKLNVITLKNKVYDVKDSETNFSYFQHYGDEDLIYFDPEKRDFPYCREKMKVKRLEVKPFQEKKYLNKELLKESFCDILSVEESRLEERLKNAKITHYDHHCSYLLHGIIYIAMNFDESVPQSFIDFINRGISEIGKVQKEERQRAESDIYAQSIFRIAWKKIKIWWNKRGIQ